MALGVSLPARRGRHAPVHRPADRADAAARRLHPEGDAAPGAAGRCTRTSSFPLLTGDGGDVRRVRPRRRRPPGAVDRPPGGNSAGVVVGVVAHPDTDRYPEGMARVAIFGDPTKALGRDRRARVPCASSRRSTSPSRWACRSSGSRCRPERRSRWTAAPRTWTGSSRVLRRLITFTQARRRGQRRRRRHQRRRPAVLERRGDDADAHPRHPRDDARQRDGAHRQAGARLLRRRLGRGQLRHRRLRPDHGPERPGPVLGARPARPRARSCFAHYEHAYVAPGERFPRRAATTDPVDRDVRSHPAPRPGQRRSTTVGDIFSTETNPERKKPFDIRTVMRAVADQDHQPLERWAEMADAETRRRVRRAPRRLSGDAARHRVPAAAAAAASCPPTGPTSGRRARCSRSRRRRWPARSTPPAATGRWWCWPTCPASTARRSRCASCSSSTAPRSAGRSSTSTARSCSASSPATTAERSWSSPGRSTTTWR